MKAMIHLSIDIDKDTLLRILQGSELLDANLDVTDPPTASVTQNETSSSEAPSKSRKKRKTRKDKGVPRGSRKATASETSNGDDLDAMLGEDSDTPAPDVVQGGRKFTKDDVSAAVRAAVEEPDGLEKVKAIFAEFGAARVSDLKKSSYASVIAKLQE